MGSVQVPGSVVLDVIAIIIVGALAMRQFREKQVKVSRLWIMPALTLLFSYTGIQSDLFDTWQSPLIIGGAFAVGMLVGAMRGAATRLSVDVKREAVVVKGTWVSVALWLALLAIKAVADLSLEVSGKADSVAGQAATLVTAALLTFSLGALIATRVYWYWRYALAVS